MENNIYLLIHLLFYPISNQCMWCFKVISVRLYLFLEQWVFQWIKCHGLWQIFWIYACNCLRRELYLSNKRMRSENNIKVSLIFLVQTSVSLHQRNRILLTIITDEIKKQTNQNKKETNKPKQNHLSKSTANYERIRILLEWKELVLVTTSVYMLGQCKYG